MTDNDQRFEADQFIYIYSSNVTAEENLLQFVLYHSSCSSSSNLFLKDRFGASQLAEWHNEEQGLISCFADITYSFEVTIPLDIDADNNTLTSLVLTTNFAGVANLTDQIFGVAISSGDSITIQIPNEINLAERKRYTLLINLAGFTDKGLDCTGVAFESFVAGVQLPSLFPSVPPATAPSITTKPTPSPETEACSVRSAVTRISDGGNECQDLANLNNRKCIDEEVPTALEFIYSGGDCVDGAPREFTCEEEAGVAGVPLVYLEIGDQGRFFAGIVASGRVLNVKDELLDEILFRTYSVVNGSKGDLLQAATNLSLRCHEDDDLTIGNVYGSLTLAGFTTPSQGTIAAIPQVTIEYTVGNSGLNNLYLDSAVVISSTSGDLQETIESPRLVPPGTDLAVTRDTVAIKLLEKERNGLTYNCTVSASGRGAVSEVPCSSSTTYTF